jgi:hypothetical protein
MGKVMVTLFGGGVAYQDKSAMVEAAIRKMGVKGG